MFNAAWLFYAVEELAPVIVFFVMHEHVSFVAGVISMTALTISLLGYAAIAKKGNKKITGMEASI